MALMLRDVSGSLYDKVEHAVEGLSGAFKEKFEAAISDCGGRLDSIREVISDYDEDVNPNFVMELTGLRLNAATKDVDIAYYVDRFIDGVVNFDGEHLWGMNLAEAVFFVRKLSGKSDSQIFSEISSLSGITFTEEDLVAAYRGGGAVDRDASATFALLDWLKKELGNLKERYALANDESVEQLDLPL